MLCPECRWWHDWEDINNPYCDFCGGLHGALPEDPPAAYEAIAEARCEGQDTECPASTE